jgi:hypothetical protein
MYPIFCLFFLLRTYWYFHFFLFFLRTYLNQNSSIAQKIPENWRTIAIENASRIQAELKIQKVKHIFSADETNLNFHYASNSVLALKGMKRISSACTINSTDGCILMVTIDFSTSQLTPTLIIYKGTFGGTFMKKWSKFEIWSLKKGSV